MMSQRGCESDDVETNISDIDDKEFDIPPVDQQPTLESILSLPDDEQSLIDSEISFASEFPRPGHAPFVHPDSETGSLSSQDSGSTRHRPVSESGRHAEDGIVLRHIELQIASAQLVSAADRIAAGLPTAVAVGSLLAVGTSRGVVLVFDAQQTLRWCLGGAAGIGAEYGAVTSLSLNADSSRLLVGHVRGQIVMWDMTSGKVLRTITNVHLSGVSVFRVCFTDDRTLALSHDSSGSVFLLEFKRLIGVRTCDFQCLFSGSRGEICCIEPLCVSQTTEDNSFSHPAVGSLFFAMASMSKMLIVALRPSLQVYYTRPLTGTSKTLPLFGWQFVSIRTSETERNTDPVLLFARDQYACFLQVLCHAADSVKFAVLKEMSLTYKLLSLSWMSSRTVVFIDMSEHAHVIDVQTADELEVIDLANLGLAYSTSLWKSLGNSTGVGRALSQAGDRLCYESVTSYGGQLIVLGMMGIHVFSVRTWIERLNVLVRRRQFGDALTMARSFYSRTGSSSTDVASVGRIRRRESLAERILELLAKYMDHVDAVSSLYCEDTNNDSYHDAASLCISHCILVGRTDALFGWIYQRFTESSLKKASFIECLEPYILSGELTRLTSDVVKDFVDHYEKKEALGIVEACIVNLDVANINVQQLTSLCWTHGLYDAVLYVYNRGMSDYVTPLEQLLAVLKSAVSSSSELTYQQVQLGNKILVYVSCCLAGRAYPLGDIPRNSVARVRTDVLHCLTDLRTASGGVNDPLYPHLWTLIQFDTREFFNVLSLAFGDIGLTDAEKQGVVDILLRMMVDTSGFTHSQVGVFFIFLARQMARPNGGISVDSRLFERVLESLCDAQLASVADGAEELSHHEERQQALLELLDTRALDHFNQERLLSLSIAAKFFRVSEMLHQHRREFDRILDCYCLDKARQSLVFEYIKQTVVRPDISVEEKQKVREAVLQHLENLICIDAKKTTKLVIVNLGIDLTEAVNQVIRYSKEDPAFDFLQCLFEVADGCSGGLGDGVWQFEPSVYERYIELLCQRSVMEGVVAFLRSHDGYRLTKTLEICQRFRISEAVIVVLEKFGDVSGAFEAALQSLRTKLSVVMRSDDLLLDELKAVQAATETIVSLLNRNSLRLEQLQLRQFWFTLFDLLIDNYNRLFSCKFDGSKVNESCHRPASNLHSERVFVNARSEYQSILQYTVNCMVSHVPFTAVLEHIVTLGGEDGIASCFGNIRDLLTSVVDACHYQQTVYTTCARIVNKDVNRALGGLTVAARLPISPHYKTCSACQQALIELRKIDEVQVICFRCGHAFHRLCLEDSGRDVEESGSPVDRRWYCVICCRSRTRFTMSYARSRVVRLDGQSECVDDSATNQPLMSSTTVESVDRLRHSQQTASRLEVLSELRQLEEVKTVRSLNVWKIGAGTTVLVNGSALRSETFSLKLAPPPAQ